MLSRADLLCFNPFQGLSCFETRALAVHAIADSRVSIPSRACRALRPATPEQFAGAVEVSIPSRACRALRPRAGCTAPPPRLGFNPFQGLSCFETDACAGHWPVLSRFQSLPGLVVL